MPVPPSAVCAAVRGQYWRPDFLSVGYGPVQYPNLPLVEWIVLRYYDERSQAALDLLIRHLSPQLIARGLPLNINVFAAWAVLVEGWEFDLAEKDLHFYMAGVSLVTRILDGGEPAAEGAAALLVAPVYEAMIGPASS